MIELSMKIKSTDKNIEPVIAALQSLVSSTGINNNNKWAIEISTREALVNAIKHGNKYKPDKLVKINFSLNNKNFTITIKDQGRGFKKTKTSKKTSTEKYPAISGRGLLIIEDKMDLVDYKQEKDGLKITMIKKIN